MYLKLQQLSATLTKNYEAELSIIRNVISKKRQYNSKYCSKYSNLEACPNDEDWRQNNAKEYYGSGVSLIRAITFLASYDPLRFSHLPAPSCAQVRWRDSLYIDAKFKLNHTYRRRQSTNRPQFPAVLPLDMSRNRTDTWNITDKFHSLHSEHRRHKFIFTYF